MQTQTIVVTPARASSQVLKVLTLPPAVFDW
jgi:hypothetical protein